MDERYVRGGWIAPEQSAWPAGGEGSLTYVPYDLVGAAGLLFAMAACDPIGDEGRASIRRAADRARDAAAREYDEGLAGAVAAGIDGAEAAALLPGDPGFTDDEVQAAYLAARAMDGSFEPGRRIDRPRRLTEAEADFVREAVAWACAEIDDGDGRACTASDAAHPSAGGPRLAALVSSFPPSDDDARALARMYPGARPLVLDPIRGLALERAATEGA